MKLNITSKAATEARINGDNLDLVEDIGYKPGKLVASWCTYWDEESKTYKKTWMGVLRRNGEEWERDEIPSEIANLIEDFIPDEEAIKEIISRRGAIALGMIKQEREQRLRLLGR